VKIVLDTNVLISGYLFDGKPERLIKFVKNGLLDLLSTDESIIELERVLRYKKFKLHNEEIEKILNDYISISEKILCKIKVDLIKEDVTDNLFLSMGLSGKADCIISGDSHILSMKDNFDIPILTVSEFFEISDIDLMFLE